MGDSYEENGSCELTGLAHSQDTIADFFENHAISETIIDSQPSHHDDVFAGNNLLTLPHKVRFNQRQC